MKKQISTAALVSMLALSPMAVQAQSAADADWKYSVMPYLWLPSIDGKLRFGPPAIGGISPNVELDAGNYLDSLDMAVMLSGTARKDRWVLGTDLIYLHFSNTEGNVHSVNVNAGNGPVNVATAQISSGLSADLKGTVWTMVGGYTVVQEPKTSFEVLGGFRYLGLDVKTDWQLSGLVTGSTPSGNTIAFARSGNANKKEDIWAGIVGARGHFNFGESDWFANAYVDVGGGSSVFTWQGRPASAMPSSGAMSFSTTAISTTVRMTTNLSTA